MDRCVCCCFSVDVFTYLAIRSRGPFYRDHSFANRSGILSGFVRADDGRRDLWGIYSRVLLQTEVGRLLGPGAWLSCRRFWCFRLLGHPAVR